jgi:hypothetical protein
MCKIGLDKMEKKMKWIKVEDQLPEKSKVVLLYQTYPANTIFNCRAGPLPTNFTRLGGLRYDGLFIDYQDQYGEPLKHITHWMELLMNPYEMIADKPDFAFGKTLGVHESIYGDPIAISHIIDILLVCMKETNKHYEVECEFFRLDFRQAFLEEEKQFPAGSLILDLKWGSKKELNQIKRL